MPTLGLKTIVWYGSLLVCCRLMALARPLSHWFWWLLPDPSFTWRRRLPRTHLRRRASAYPSPPQPASRPAQNAYVTLITEGGGEGTATCELGTRTSKRARHRARASTREKNRTACSGVGRPERGLNRRGRGRTVGGAPSSDTGLLYNERNARAPCHVIAVNVAVEIP